MENKDASHSRVGYLARLENAFLMAYDLAGMNTHPLPEALPESAYVPGYMDKVRELREVFAIASDHSRVTQSGGSAAGLAQNVTDAGPVPHLPDSGSVSPELSALAEKARATAEAIAISGAFRFDLSNNYAYRKADLRMVATIIENHFAPTEAELQELKNSVK